MSNIDKRALREAAEKATPGEWWIDSHGMAMVAHHNDNTMIVFVTDGEQMGKAIRHEDTGNLSHWRNDNDASFIAAANPATVLALLDELEAAEKRIAELEAREVVLPQRYSMLHRVDFDEPYHTEMVYKQHQVLEALHDAGVNVAAAGKGE